jgi:hypothetical protein
MNIIRPIAALSARCCHAWSGGLRYPSALRRFGRIPPLHDRDGHVASPAPPTAFMRGMASTKGYPFPKAAPLASRRDAGYRAIRN